MSVDTLIQKYLSSRKNIEKLFMYELDCICKVVKEDFGKVLFKPGDKKTTRVNKIHQLLKQMPQLLQYSTSEEEITDIFQLKSLKQTYMDFILKSNYPKEYLAAPVAEITHLESVKEWEAKSGININLKIPGIDNGHIIFNYPEYSLKRKQLEMRTFDYTHILNNLCYHICSKGLDGIKTSAFISVSNVNHDVLPRAIVEDKMDRQNCTISQRFFSANVQEILQGNGHHAEAEFVELTRNWFQVCDERGMEVVQHLKYLNDMYLYLLSKHTFSTYPPPKNYIAGIPIKTYEALLHCISTRLSLFCISSTHSYNTRAISTLAVESFFSDLARYEFSGLGAPKAVDIPKLISHVVHLNMTKHDSMRGFEYTTSTRDNYPVYLLENEVRNSDNNFFASTPFNVKGSKKSKTKKHWFTLSKPKQVSKGGKGIRQYMKIDETKLSSEQRLGENVELDKCTI